MDKNGRTNRLLSRLAVGLMLAAMALFTGCPNKITVKPETFAVTFSAGEHGTVGATVDSKPISSGNVVQKDKTVVFTAVPEKGYEVEKWTVNGTAAANNVSTTYSHKVTAKIEVKVSFKVKPPAAVAVTGVALNKRALTLEEGKSEQLTATVTPTNATNKKVSWSSDKQDIASVDATGKVTAHKVGEAVITVTSEDGGKTASCKVNVTAKPPTTYKITFSVDGTGGSITAKVGDTEIHTGDTVEQGKTVIFTATPVDANHKVKEWQVDSVVISNTTTSHTLTVTKAINVTVSFKGIEDGHAWYKVEHYQENTDGTYPSTPAGIEENLSGAKGASLSIGTGITLKEYSGFEFDKLEPAAPTIAADGSTVVKVLYKRKTINVTFNLDGGNIGGNTGDKVIQGKYGTPLNAPNNPDRANHVFKGWSPKLTATFPDHDSVHTAQWTALHTIAFSVDGPGGTLKAKVDGIEINSGDKVEKDKTVTFTAKALLGYELEKWTLDGTEVNGTALTYTLKVTANAQVKVFFKPNGGTPITKHTVTITTPVNGSVTSSPEIPSDNQVPENTEITFTATPAEGYAVDTWTVIPASALQTGGSSESVTATVKITEDTTVTVTFKRVKFKIHFGVDGANGTLKAKVDGIEINSGDKVEKDKTVTFTATADSGYVVDKWTISGSSFESGSGTDGSTTAKVKVTANTTVQVTFKPEGGTPPTPPSSDVGSFEDTGDGFIKISPPAAGITGKDPTYTLPGPQNFWKGVFRAGRKVKLSPYKLGKTEVPYKLWKEVYDWAIGNGYTFVNEGQKGSSGSGSEEEPVTKVSWRDCVVWCNAYTQKTNNAESDCVYRKKDDHTVVLKDATDTAACDDAYADMSKKGFRLPTEAEWEYAARWQGSDNTNAEQYGEVWLTKLNSASGAKADWNNADETKAVAWYGANSDYKTHPVGEKRSNALGLHDMSGNVWEWCFDRYNDNPRANDAAYTSGGFVVDPQGAASGNYRVLRGGSWHINARLCVVGIRNFYYPDSRNYDLGFRVAMSKN